MSKVIKKEVTDWLEGDEETALIDLKVTKDDQLQFVIGEEEQKFSINFPKDYPKSKEKLFVFSEDKGLSDWQSQLNEFIGKKNPDIKTLLTKAADLFLDMGEEEEEEEEDEDNALEDDLGLDSVVAPDPKKKAEEEEKKKKQKEEMEFETKNFLEIGSPTATMRLIKDLKNIQKGDPKQLGFSASPAIDAKSGMENLYLWDVKLFGFEPKSDLGKDMESFKKKTKHDHILLELRFSKDYPFAPPFVRVVRPRFAFRTGHVTVGGSICMELLTNSGWNSTNDIESILIQIRAEMTSGNARLDPGMNSSYEYSEHEAWDAFFRAASTHGWSTNGINKNAYDLVKR